MKKLLIILLLALSVLHSASYAQSETNDFITYDTTFTAGSQLWIARISRPANMFTANHPDTASRAGLITMPGLGESGTNYANLVKYGPHYWLNNGWDGSIVTGNGTHYPILITLISQFANPRINRTILALQHLLNTYHIKRNSVHLGGLSMGAFTWAGLINGQLTAGGEEGMKLVTSLVLLQGDGQGATSGLMGSAIPYHATNYSAFGHWASKYGGTFFGLEGTTDGRTVWAPRDDIEDSVGTGAAYFAFENMNGGQHCCWNEMYDPNRKNWKCTQNDLGTNIAWNTNHNNSMGNYQNGWSVFEWMFRQGDTTLVGTGNAPPIVDAGSNQTITLPEDSAQLNANSSDSDGTITSYWWTKISGPTGSSFETPALEDTKVTGLVEGTYVFELTVTDNGGASSSDQVTVIVNPDTTINPSPAGKKMVGPGEYQNLFIDKYGHLWGGGNIGNIGVNNTGSVGIIYPVQVTPSDLKFKTCAGGLHGAAAVDTTGFVWVTGDNDQYQHGIGNNTHPIYSPSKITIDSAGNAFGNVRKVVGYFVKNVSEGYNGFYAIKNDGTLWGWGRMIFGMRGDGTAGADKSRPVQIIIPGGRLVDDIVAGQFSIALCTDGTVWVWGQGVTYPGYSGTTEDKWAPKQLTGLSNIKSIAGGMLWNYALASNNVLYGWGSYGNYMGVANGLPIATPTPLTNITNALPAPISKIVTNSASTHVILTDSTLWGWGNNGQGTIGNGQRINFHINGGNPFDRDNLVQLLPVQVAPGIKFDTIFGASVYTYHSYARDVDDSLYCWGRGKASTLANKLASPSSQITAVYGNSWDIPWPTPVDPFNINVRYLSTSDYCVKVDATGSPCNQYAIPANTAPVADAGSDQDLGDVSETTLDGTGSTDNVYIATFVWSQISGPNQAVFDLNASPTPTVRGLVAGEYIFQLKVIDNSWLEDSATVTVTIGTQTNEPPVITTLTVSADTIQSPTSTVTVTFASTDTEGTVEKVLQVHSAPGGSSVNIAAPSGNDYVITGMTIPGIYIFRAFATDENSVTVFQDITVVVIAAATGSGTVNKYKVNITNASTTVSGWNNWYTSADGTSINNIKDTANVVSNISFTLSKSSVPSANAIPTSALTEFSDSVFQYVSYNTINRTLTGTGFKIGVPYRFDLLTHRNIANNTCFTINGVKQCITAQGNVDSLATFSGITTDNGTIVVGINGEPSTPAYLAAFIVTEQGDEALQNVPPVAVVDTNLHVIMISETDSVYIDGSASYDPDGTIASATITLEDSNVPIDIVSATSLSSWIRGLQVGVYTFRLTVTDNDGAMDSKIVTVYVIPEFIRRIYRFFIRGHRIKY